MPLHPLSSHREYVSGLALSACLPVCALPHTHTKLLQLSYCRCFKTAGTRRWHSTSTLTGRLNGIASPPTPAQAMTAAMAATMVWRDRLHICWETNSLFPEIFLSLCRASFSPFSSFRFTSRSLLTFFLLHISQMASSIGDTFFLSSDIVVEAKTLTCEDLFKSVRLRIHCFDFITHRLVPTG